MRFSIALNGSRVDGREQLRRYLEQRRETGELELVLDQLDVDEVMRLVGAAPSTPSAPSAPLVQRPHQAETPAPTAPEPGHASANWRDVLRDAGADPNAGTEQREQREQREVSASPSDALDAPP